MGAKTWMLVYSNGDARARLKGRPTIDRDASARFAAVLFPDVQLQPMDDGDLSYTNPPEDEIFAGCYPGVSVIAADEFGLDYPSKLPPFFVRPEFGNTIYLHAMHSVVDFFAYAIWKDGKLVRSLSLAPDYGVMENMGEPLNFEKPYWEGRFPVGDPSEPEEERYPFPFHPLELGEAALRELLGYQIEGMVDPSLIVPWDLPLLRFKRGK